MGMILSPTFAIPDITSASICVDTSSGVGLHSSFDKAILSLRVLILSPTMDLLTLHTMILLSGSSLVCFGMRLLLKSIKATISLPKFIPPQ